MQSCLMQRRRLIRLQILALTAPAQPLKQWHKLHYNAGATGGGSLMVCAEASHAGDRGNPCKKGILSGRQSGNWPAICLSEGRWRDPMSGPVKDALSDLLTDSVMLPFRRNSPWMSLSGNFNGNIEILTRSKNRVLASKNLTYKSQVLALLY